MGLGFKTFVAGVLSASDVNGYLMQQSVIVCTSATRPGSPVTGMTIYETDTLQHRSWSGAGWDALPGTVYGESSTSGSVTLATAATNAAVDTTCKVTVTLNSQRRVKVWAQANFTVAATPPARFSIIPAYTAGGTVGAITPVGTNNVRVSVGAVGTSSITSGVSEQSVVLAAGTYTFFVAVARDNGGSATDAANTPTVRVTDAGPA